jgi:hypothetical protein
MAQRTLDRVIACALGFAALVVYARAIPQTYAFWDTGELQTVASILGIEHPPGSPAFILLAFAFAHVLPVGEMAWRVNLFSSLSVALAVCVLYATMRRLALPRIIGALGTLAFAFSKITLTFATRAEVHDLALCFSACALYAAVRYEGERRARDAFLCALAFGLFAATHGVALFLFPALAIVFIFRPPPTKKRAATLGLIALGVVIGLLPYAYIAPRAAWLFSHHVDPTLALGLPPGLPFWDYGDPETPARFWDFVTGAEFHVHSGFDGYFQLERYAGYAGALIDRLGNAYGTLGMLLALLGGAFLLARRDIASKALVVATVLAVPYTESYSDLQQPDRYYLLALWCAAIAIAVAFERIVELLPLPRMRPARAALALALACALAFAVPPRGDVFASHDDRGAPNYVDYVKSVTPDDAVVLAEWAYSSPLAYASYVEHSLGNRTPVASGPKQYESYFPTWLAQKRPLYIVTFDQSLVLRPYTLKRITTDENYGLYAILPPRTQRATMRRVRVPSGDSGETIR